MLSFLLLRGSRSPGRQAAAVLAAVLPIVLTGFAAAIAGGVTPLAPVPEDTPWTRSYQTRQSRLHEAHTKARLLAKGLLRDSDKDFNATPNMDLYDVHFYDLVLDLDPVGQVLTGLVTVEAEVTGTDIATLDLNLLGLTVTQVSAGGVMVPFAHVGEVLTVTLDKTYLQGEQVSVQVAYSGNPAGDYFGWNSYGGQPLIWTLSEPYGAREWWPCKDVNTDKADSVDITVTVPDNLVVASNGLLVAETVPAPGKKTFAWQERYSIVTYLVSLAIHPYTLLQDEYHSALGDTMPLEYYVVSDQVGQAASGFAIVPDMLTAFSAGFGEYPFVNEKYGHAQFPWGGGMEHQTMTSLGVGLFDQWIISHELAHQWFGDFVTCADFGHIWLNEGFATWSEAYWREVNEGVVAYHQEMADARYLGGGTIFVENTSNIWDIFDYNLSYLKASWIPHMLRHMLGEADFFTAVNQYLDIYGHGSATTEQFQAVFENVSGLDLNAFFQQWIYGDYYPVYDFSWNWWPSGGGYEVSVRVEQIQLEGGLFSMPLDVVVSTTGGTETFVINQTDEVQWHSFQVNDPVTAVELDPDHWVLREVHDNGVTRAGEIPVAARLVGNAPNPFNPATEIRFTLPADQAVRVSVYDVSGRLVKTLVDEVRPAGDNRILWDGTDLHGRSVASGTYFTRMTGAGLDQVRPMSLIR
ncbi:MAG: M1 family aminopeptidase [Candidatus Krumholzibacteriota bacterium]